MLSFELWEAQSGNLMASFDREADALAVIVARAQAHGAASIDSVALIQVDDEADEDSEMVELAQGAELLARAAATVSHAPNGQVSAMRLRESA